MSSKKTALVIGAGIGGIATAGRLARNGYEVTVLEKNSQPGGRCNQIVRDGHRFDVGPTLFLMPEVFAETYAALGEKMSDHLDLRRIDPTYSVRFDDGISLQLTSDIRAMQQQLEAIEPGAFTGFLCYLNEGHVHYRVSLEKFVGRNFYHFAQYFSPANLPLLFKLKALSRHYSNVGRYFTDPHLKAAFTFQNMYLGLSPYDAPATYSLLQYTELAEGIWFPIGGMYRIVETLTTIAQKLGARFLYDTPVVRIETDEARRTTTRARLQDGRSLEADLVVINADLPYAYRELLPDPAEARQLDR
jgi:phytoene desaturase